MKTSPLLSRLIFHLTSLVVLMCVFALFISPPATVKVLQATNLPEFSNSYPPDPSADIAWNAGYSGVADIQAAFNYARGQENAKLGLSVPMLALPSQSAWNAMNNGEKAIWLINRERQDRSVAPLHNIETNVTSVAQNYAQYLLANNKFGHNADGHDPWWRLDQNPAIFACHDNLSVAENIAGFWTTGSSIALPIEQSIYGFMYEDGECCSWGHRHAVLWYPYNDNSGPAGREGFLGIGRASGPHMGWNFAEIIVMNIFDQCSTWVYDLGPNKNFLSLVKK